MTWLSRIDFGATDYLQADDLNNLGNDIRQWGGPVNGGGQTLSNVVLSGVAIPGGLPDPTTNIGDLIVRNTTTLTTPPTRLGVGTDGQVLTADHTVPSGIKWATPAAGSGGGAVASVFGRTGAVVAQTGDYLVSQVTGAVPNTVQILAGPGLTGGGNLSGNVTLNAIVTSVFGRGGAVTLTAADISGAGGVPATRQVLTPSGSGLSGGGALTSDLSLSAAVVSVFGRTGAVALTSADLTGAGAVLTSRQILAGTGLTGGGNLSADRNLSVLADSTNQQVQVLHGAVLAGTRHAINFTDTASATWSIADNPTSNRIDVSVVATGGSGGGLADPTTTLGDLLVRGPSAVGRLGVGQDGYVLTADHTQPVGVKWAANTGSGAVTSVFTRTGAVVAAAGDYSASQVNNAVDVTQTYANPAWITSLAWNKITGAPATGVASVFGRTGVVVAAGGDYAASQVTNAIDATQAYANPAWITSLAWSKITGAPAAGVASVFTRTGAVVAAIGDYTAAMVTNAVDSTQSYSNPAWISALAWTKITGAPSVSSYQTPWLSNIDGGNFQLADVSRIGVGTTAPVAMIDTGSNSAPIKIATYGDGTWFSGIGVASNELTFASGIAINGTPQMVLTNAGLLGIGTLTPGATFHVVNPQTGPAWVAEFQDSDSSNTSEARIVFTQGSSWYQGISGAYNSGNPGLIFACNSTPGTWAERMRITSAGLCGIGTPTPLQNLDISTSATQAIYACVSSSGYERLRLGFVYPGYVPADNAVPAQVLADADGDLLLSTRTDFASNIQFYTCAAYAAIERMRITSAGLIGINTTSPAYTVDIAGDCNITGAYRINGVPIGTGGSGGGTPGGPSGSLQINNSGAFIGYPDLTWVTPGNILTLGASAGATFQWGATSQGHGVLATSAAKASIALMNTNAQRWLISTEDTESGSNTGGNLYFEAHDDTGNWIIDALFIKRANGYVGMQGQDSPAYPLDVNGDINITGTYRVNGVPLATGGGGAVTSVFSRTGAVVAVAGDYSAFYASLTGSYANPAWITSLPWSKITSPPAIVNTISPGTLSGAVTLAGGANVSVTQSSQTITIAATGLVPTATQVIAGTGLTGGGALSASVTLSAVALGASGTGHAAGFAPDPGATAGTTRFLREDATWQAPPSAPVTSVFTRTGAVVAAAADYSAFYVSLTGSYSDPAWITALSYSKLTAVPAMVNTISPGTLSGAVTLAGGANVSVTQSAQTITIAATGLVPTTTQVIAGAGLSGGGALSANVTLTAVTLGASGASHAAGIAPDPGSTAGTTRFLREDATWQAPPAAPVTSVFTRTGAVVAAAADYSAYYVSLTGSYASPTWLTQINWSIITGVPTMVNSISPGTLSGAVTLAGGANINVTQSSQTITVAATGLVPTTTQVIAGTGMSGGGALSANVTLNRASILIRIGHTFAVLGDCTNVTAMPSFFVPLSTGQSANLVGIRAVLASGTSVGVQVVRNGANVGSVITVTTTATTTTLSQALAANDQITLVLSSPVGTPTTLSATLFIEHTV